MHVGKIISTKPFIFEKYYLVEAPPEIVTNGRLDERKTF